MLAAGAPHGVSSDPSHGHPPPCFGRQLTLALHGFDSVDFKRHKDLIEFPSR
jgi:hypothetical protein